MGEMPFTTLKVILVGAHDRLTFEFCVDEQYRATSLKNSITIVTYISHKHSNGSYEFFGIPTFLKLPVHIYSDIKFRNSIMLVQWVLSHEEHII